MILVLAQQTFLQQKSVEQPTFLLLLHKNAAAHPPSFAEEILLGYQLWKIKGIWTLILNFPMRGRIVASAAFGSCEKAYKYRSLDWSVNEPFLSPSLAIPHLHSIFESRFCVFWGCQIVNHALTGNSSWGTHLGKFVLCLFQQQQSFRKNYPDDLHMMQGSLRVTIHLSWKPCVFSASPFTFCWMRDRNGSGMKRKPQNFSTVVWRAGDRREKHLK